MYRFTNMEQLKGKRILFVSGDSPGRLVYWKATRNYDIQTYLVEQDPDHHARDMVDHFLIYDIADRSKDSTHAAGIINMLRGKAITVDGCLTFCDAYIPLTAMLCTLLELPGLSVETATCVKSKYLTHDLISKNDQVAHFATPSFQIDNHDDIDKAAEKLQFPAFMKSEYGAAASGATSVNSVQDCHNYLNQVQQYSKAGSSIRGFGFSPKMVLMNYIEGTEHTLDLFIQNGKLLAAFTRDKGVTEKLHPSKYGRDYDPTLDSSYHETTSLMPSHLSQVKEKQLIQAAFQCCTAVGLHTGIANVDMKMTDEGPKLLEINARLSGSHAFKWTQIVYGVDLLASVCLLACQITPKLNNITPRTNMIGIMMRANLLSSVVEKVENLHTQGLLIFVKRRRGCGLITLQHDDAKMGKDKLIAFCEELGLSSDEYPARYFINSLFESF